MVCKFRSLKYATFSLLMLLLVVIIFLCSGSKLPTFKFHAETLVGDKHVSDLRNKTNRTQDEGKEKRLPDVLIIGSAKCGTSTLYRYLAFHPDVVRADGEIGFFTSESRFARGVAWYKKQMPESELGQLTLEKTPNYIKYPKRIKSVLPNARFIWTVCEPFRRAVSLYLHNTLYKRRGFNKGLTFEETIMKKQNGKFSTLHESRGLVKDGRYAVLLRNWLKYFSMDSLFIVNGDSLKEHLIPQLQKLETFLGLKPYVNESYFKVNKHGFYTLKNCTRQLCVGNDKGTRKHPNVDPVVEDEIRRYFQPLNEEFYVLINRTFDWNSKVSSSNTLKTT